MENRRNHYRILHVQPDAPAEIIRASYLTLMRRLEAHPDLGGDHWNAALINAAYAVLRDPASRAEYDRARTVVAPWHRGALPAASSAPPPAEPNEADATPAALAHALAACVFCGGANAAGASTRPTAVCDICGSPLWEVSPETAHDTCRALARTPRCLPVEYYVTWPQRAPFQGEAEDFSVAGMGFVTALELVPDECIKVVSSMLEAIGIVRHVRPRWALTPGWFAGVEFVTFRAKLTRGGLVSVEA